MGSDARFQVRLITPGSIAHASPGRSPRGCQRAPQRIRSTREQVTFGVTGRRKSRRVSLTASCNPSFLYLGVTWDQRHGSWTFWPRSSCPTSYLLGSQGRNPRHKGQGLPPAIRCCWCKDIRTCTDMDGRDVSRLQRVIELLQSSRVNWTILHKSSMGICAMHRNCSLVVQNVYMWIILLYEW
jgi:hypothetical protein